MAVTGQASCGGYCVLLRYDCWDSFVARRIHQLSSADPLSSSLSPPRRTRLYRRNVPDWRYSTRNLRRGRTTRMDGGLKRRCLRTSLPYSRMQYGFFSRMITGRSRFIVTTRSSKRTPSYLCWRFLNPAAAAFVFMKRRYQVRYGPGIRRSCASPRSHRNV